MDNLVNGDPDNRILTSSPTSTTSGSLSQEIDQLVPTSLAAEELQLALNKVIIYSIYIFF